MTTHPDVQFLDRASPPHISTLILLAGMAALAMNIFLPSLPAMTRYFDTDYRVMQLSVALFLGMNAVMQLLIGPLSDRYGRRPVLLWSIGLFTLASLGCVLATSIEVFLAFRMGQAVIVAGIVPQPGRCTRYYAARFSGLKNRLCDDGHVVGADDGPGCRRGVAGDFRMARQLLADGHSWRSPVRADLGRSG